jgi:PIN domain nuclease of toxin-antitoxin system
MGGVDHTQGEQSIAKGSSAGRRRPAGGVAYEYIACAAQGYLLDSHTFLWAVKKPERLGVRARDIIESLDNRLFLSAISAYEITQKLRLGKLDPSYTSVAERVHETAALLGAAELPVSLAEADFAGKLAWEHRDPFDRFLAAQALLNNLVLLSNDAALGAFDQIKAVW